MWQIDCCWNWCIPQLSLLRRLGSVFVKPSGYQPNFFLLHLFFFFFSPFHLKPINVNWSIFGSDIPSSLGPVLSVIASACLSLFVLYLWQLVCCCNCWGTSSWLWPACTFQPSYPPSHIAADIQNFKGSSHLEKCHHKTLKSKGSRRRSQAAAALNSFHSTPMLAIIPNRTVVTLWLHWHCLGLCLCLLITLTKCLRGCNCKPLWSVVEGAVFVRDPDSGSFSSLAPSPVSLSVHHSVYHWHSQTRYLEVVLWGILGYYRTWHGVNHDLVH